MTTPVQIVAIGGPEPAHVHGKNLCPSSKPHAYCA